MSTPEQPDTPQLTRRQLREIRNTGVTPVVTPEDLDSAAAESVAPDKPDPAPTPVHAPLARAADPVPVAEAPASDASVDLGVSPLTRRQARQQERIRTASVPVITPEVAAAHTRSEEIESTDSTEQAEPEAPIDTPSWWSAVATQVSPLAEDGEDTAQTGDAEEQADAETGDEPEASAGVDDLFAPLVSASDESESSDDSDADADSESESESAGEEAPAAERPILNPKFGADLLSGQSQADALPPSFDQLITRSSTGAVGTSNALIMSQPSGPSPIVAPVTATGEVLVTGTLNLPEGLGSIGHAPGAADGKEVDAVLVDGELPAHSSPTPIAASAAISTVKNTGDVIRPPAPEKGSKLMISLAITAGVLALALVGVLIVAIFTGVFQ